MTTPQAYIGIANVSAGKLKLGAQTQETITCTPASADVAATGDIPDGTKYISVHAAALFVVAVDEATSATVGLAVGANTPQTIPIELVDGGDGKVHVQSATDNTVVYVTYLQD